ncbi:MAG: stage III sporulation protein AB [Christensenellaceae bacterium]|nr:stage III sporulation protein AB [Christensenellaceae bacterium]
MKLFACLAVFCGCVAVGVIVYCRAKTRVAFYSGLIAFCNNLLTEISFTLTPIAQIIDRYVNSYTKEFRAVLFNYRKLLTKKTDITREKCLEIVNDPQVADFFYNLGRAGVNEERDKITTAAQLFSQNKADAEEYLKTKAIVTLKIMIIVGIAGAILLA